MGLRGYVKAWGFLPTALVLGIYSWALSLGITLGRSAETESGSPACKANEFGPYSAMLRGYS